MFSERRVWPKGIINGGSLEDVDNRSWRARVPLAFSETNPPPNLVFD